MSGKRVTLETPPRKEGNAERFVVTFRLIPTQEEVGRRYFVCTVLGERKALTMAVGVHQRDHPDEIIYDVAECRRVDGTAPMHQDIVDRQEW